jgi:hypothetical protein
MDVNNFILIFVIFFITTSSGLPSELKIGEESTSLQIIDFNGEKINEERVMYEKPASTIPIPELKREEIRNLKFVFPKGHFINDLLHYNHFD